jgi:tetratricopeptide (TPR) repeat protein
MRITPLLIVEAVLAALLAICCLYTWYSGSYQRSTAGAWRDARAEMRVGEGAKAAEALERFLEFKPACPGVRLQLAGLYLADDDPKVTMAATHLEQVAKDVSSDVAGGVKGRKRLQALAEVMLGTIKARAAVQSFGEGGPAAVARFESARAHFEAAIKLENPGGLKTGTAGKTAPEKAKDTAKRSKEPEKKAGKKSARRSGRPKYVAFGDACVGLGLIALWLGDFDTAEVRLRQGLSGESVLGKGVHQEAYNGLGVALAAKKEFSEASSMFRRVLHYRPGCKAALKNLDMVQRAMAGSDDLTTAERARLLKDLVKKNPSPNYTMSNLLGCCYYRQGDMLKAVKCFQRAISKDPEKRLAQFNLLALRWANLRKTRAAYFKWVAKLYPADKMDPDERYWRTAVLAQGRKRKARQEEKDRHNESRQAYYTAEMLFDGSAVAVLKNIKNLPAEVEKALLHIRARYLLTTSLRLKGSKSAKVRARGRGMRAAFDQLCAAGIKRFGKDHAFKRMLGIGRLESGENVAALDALRQSLAAKPDQPDIKAALAVFAGEPVIRAFRPRGAPLSKRKSVLARSARPLLGAVFQARTGAVQISGAKAVLKIGGKPVKAFFWGSELLYRPASDLPDGRHELVAEAEDLLGRKVSAKTGVLVDNSPPEITKMTPSAGSGVTSRLPKLVIHYQDKYSGVDPTSVNVELRSDRGASVYFAKFVVMGGRFTYGHEDAAKGVSFKAGDMVGSDKVIFVPHRKLGTGRYRVTITVGDVRGLKTSKSFFFTVTR